MPEVYETGDPERFDPGRSIRLADCGMPFFTPTLTEQVMITCFIRYQIDPTKKAQFEHYARTWGQAIPRCGANLIGYFAPHEGSTTLAYGVYSIENLAAYEAYRGRLSADPMGQENYAFAMREKFILREDRNFLKLASTPHGKLIGFEGEHQ